MVPVREALEICGLKSTTQRVGFITTERSSWMKSSALSGGLASKMPVFASRNVEGPAANGGIKVRKWMEIELGELEIQRRVAGHF